MQGGLGCLEVKLLVFAFSTIFKFLMLLKYAFVSANSDSLKTFIATKHFFHLILVKYLLLQDTGLGELGLSIYKGHVLPLG